MYVLVDTNVILDYLDAQRKNTPFARQIVKECFLGRLGGYISAMSIPNSLYILRKKITGVEAQKRLVRSLKDTFIVTDLMAEDFDKVADLNFKDYEDALQAVAAERVGAQYIITNNLKHFENSRVPAITPEEFVREVLEKSPL